ncbi:MAG: hypothetical protein ABWX67_12815 [Allosphingosinicella sp.]
MTVLRAAAGLALMLAAPAGAQSPEDGVRATIARWYEELAKKDMGRHWSLAAPGFIDASPPYEHVDTGSRALGPRIYTSLAAQAVKFAYDIDSIRRDSSFARVQVWERGYFYAWAAQKTYERAASTTFVLERQAKDGSWRILAHRSDSIGIPPNKVTDPMPDLRALYYSTGGKDRDPARDARGGQR